MAKKGSRVKFGMTCEICKATNYISSKNKVTTTEAMKLDKYCKVCRKKTTHKEKKKLH